MPSHYDTLGVSPTSEPEVIEAAYKALIRKYHPDRAGDNDRIREINVAYAVLSNSSKRRAYDASRKGVSVVSEAASRHRDTRKQAQFGKPTPRGEDDPKKRCPECGERVAGMAQVCRYCGYRFHKPHKPKMSSAVGCGWALLAAVVVLLFVAMFSPAPPAENTEEPSLSTTSSVLDWLKEGNAQVCSDQGVQLTAVAVFVEMLPELNEAFQPILERVHAGQPNPFRFEATSMTGKDEAISEVSCEANLRLAGTALPVSYKIRPSMDEESAYVVEAESDRADEILAGLLVEFQKRVPVAAPQAEVPAATTDGQSVDVRPLEMPEGLTPEGEALYEELNSKCRGGSGDDPQTMEYCAQRDAMWETDV